jgi:hypothetical protein
MRTRTSRSEGQFKDAIAEEDRRTGKQKAAIIDIGNLASGLILPPVSVNFFSK